MSQITGGSFTYGRRVKTGDFEHKEASLVINFSVDEGDASGSDWAAKAADTATAEVSRKLGLNPPAAQPAPQTQAAPASAETPKPTQRRGRGPAKPPAVETQALPTGGQEADPFAEGSTNSQSQTTSTGTAGKPTTETPTGQADNGFDDDLLAAPAAEITDKDFVAAVFAHNQKVNNGPAIRELIGKYVVAPKGARDIPQELRKKFLEDLAKIGKAI